jgi:surface protein
MQKVIKGIVTLVVIGFVFVAQSSYTEARAEESGVLGTAPWTLDDYGTLTVGGGFIETYTEADDSIPFSPWYEHSSKIFSITFTDTITTGDCLSGLFNGLYYVTEINGLSNLNTSGVKNMSGMFSDTRALESLNFTGFVTSSVENMSRMFCNTYSLVDIVGLSSFNTSNVTNMSAMFQAANGLTTLDLFSFNTREVKDMSSMFHSTSNLINLNISSFETDNVIDMSSMFLGARYLKSLDLSSFNTAIVTDMSTMFNGMSDLESLDLSNLFNTSSVTNMSGMFRGTTKLKHLKLSSDFNFFDGINGTPSLPPVTQSPFTGWQNVGAGTVSIPNGSYFFTSAQLMAQYDPITNPDMADTWVWAVYTESTAPAASVTPTSKTFDPAQNGYSNTGMEQIFTIENIGEVPISGLSASIDGTYFEISTSLTAASIGISGSVSIGVKPVNGLTAREAAYTGTLRITGNDGINKSVPLSFGVYADEIVKAIGIIGTAHWILYEDGRVEVGDGEIYTQIYLPSWYDYKDKIYSIIFIEPIIAGPSLHGLFYGLHNVTTIDGLTNINTSNVTDMSGMFRYTSSLKSLDLSNFDTSNVTTMSYMFSDASSLKSLDLSNFDTSNVTDMSYMFNDASSLEGLSLSSFNTARVTNMGYMFRGASSLESLDLSNFNTALVTSMASMFSDASSLGSLDLSNFNTARVTNMGSMFSYTSSLENLELSNFNTASVTDMDSMFAGTRSLTSLDLSSFDTAKVTSMIHMFFAASSLKSLDLSNFETANVTNMRDMFESMSSLTSLDLSNFNTASVTNMNFMFSLSSALQQLKLGSDFNFIDGSIGGLNVTPDLTTVPPPYAGWRNVGTGTVDNPNGSYLFTSEQLMAQYDPIAYPDMADTWVWAFDGATPPQVLPNGRTYMHYLEDIPRFLGAGSRMEASGKLPDGLALGGSSADGYFIGGFPTKAGSYQFTIREFTESPGDEAEVLYSLRITASDVPLRGKPVEITALVGAPFTYQFEDRVLGDSQSGRFLPFLDEGSVYPAFLNVRTGAEGDRDELYGVSAAAGVYNFTIIYPGGYGIPAPFKIAYILTVVDIKNMAVEEIIDLLEDLTDPEYSFIDPNNYSKNEYYRLITSYEQTLSVSKGSFLELENERISFNGGMALTRGVHYTAESGSTKITIFEQTFKNIGNGTYLIAAEFRASDNKIYESYHVLDVKVPGTPPPPPYVEPVRTPPAAAPPARGDLNGDGKVDLTDFNLLLRYFSRPGSTVNRTAADVNGDGKINGADLLLLLRIVYGTRV